MNNAPILHASPMRSCDHCRTVYDTDDSSARRVTLFCSRVCEVADYNERAEDYSRIRREVPSAPKERF